MPLARPLPIHREDPLTSTIMGPHGNFSTILKGVPIVSPM